MSDGTDPTDPIFPYQRHRGRMGELQREHSHDSHINPGGLFDMSAVA